MKKIAHGEGCSHKEKSGKHLDEVLVLGLLAEASNSQTIVDLNVIVNRLGDRGITTNIHALSEKVEEIIRSYKWFGLGWTDSEMTRLETIGGVRWFCLSGMYDRLLKTKTLYIELANQFAKVVSKLPLQIVNPRVLVDAGSTTFYCFFDEKFEQFRRNVDSLLTNNLFVAMRWQEEFKNSENVRLIGGTPHIDTAATVKNEKLEQWLSTTSRRPDVSLLSWHYVKPVENGKIKLYTKDEREFDMKKAAMEVTRETIYVVWNKEKITEKVPTGACPYDLEDLIESQKKKPDRRVYFITDLAEKSNALQMEVFNRLNKEPFKSNRVELVCPLKKSD